MQTIHGVLFEQVNKQPDSLAIYEDGWNLTYAELRDAVMATTDVLRGMGFNQGDRFALWAPNCAEWIIVALAGQALGGVLVPLNTRYKGGEAADIIRRADCRFLFTVDGFLNHDYPAMLAGEDLPGLKETVVIKGASGRGAFNQFLIKDRVSGELPDVRPDNISDIIFTSGTTGAPKGAMTNHGQNVQVFDSFTTAIGMNAQDRYLIVNPFFHSFGYKAGWLSCLIKGAAIFPLAVFDPKVVLEQIETDKISVMPGAPTIFQSLLHHRKRQAKVRIRYPNCEVAREHDISSLRVATTGATTIPVDLIRRMNKDLGIDHVYSAYGLTESTGVVSLCQQGDNFKTIATTCGRPLPGTDLRLVGDDGQDVKRGEEGEIWVKGFNVMQGYLDDPAATAETITPEGWLKTGDIGTQDAKGYIKITDRKKDMIIVGGFNCYPAEVEKLLLQHPDIVDIAIVGEPDARLGEVTHAHIVQAGGLTLEDVVAWSREHMANFKVPRRVTFHESLPRNASGKIQKFKLS